jgi:hypothetical protein
MTNVMGAVFALFVTGMFWGCGSAGVDTIAARFA